MILTKTSRLRAAAILVREITATDFKLRYHDSVLGYVWSVLKPLAMFMILYLVFAKIFKVGDEIPNYPVYLLVGIVMWSFFLEATSSSLTSVVEKGDLLRKISFPKYIIIASKISSSFINLLINFIIVGMFMLVFGADPSWLAILVLPLLILEYMLLSMGVGLILGTLYVKFRDLNYIWEVLMQAMFYGTPILYPLTFVVTNFSERFAELLMLNPIAQIIQDVRRVLVTPDTVGYGNLISNEWMRVVPITISLLLFVIGVSYFKKHSKYFGEYV